MRVVAIEDGLFDLVPVWCIAGVYTIFTIFIIQYHTIFTRQSACLHVVMSTL